MKLMKGFEYSKHLDAQDSSMTASTMSSL